MKRFIFLLISFIPLISFAQKAKIIYLTGSVGKYKAEMTLQIYDDKQVGGFYHYEGKQAWLNLQGESSDGINFTVKEFPYEQGSLKQEMATGLFTGTLDKDNIFKGQWTAPDRPALEFLFAPGSSKKGLGFVSESYRKDTSWTVAENETYSVSSSIGFLRAVPANAVLDTFMFHRLYYNEMFGDNSLPVFPDYRSIGDEYIRLNTGSESNMDWDAGCDVIWNGSGVLSISCGSWEYSGGAHGNGYEEYSCFNLRTGKKITTDDIFIKGYEEPLRLKAIEHLDQDPDFIERDSLQLNGNFFVTPEGIEFFYNSYEITAYANGTPTSFIPWKEMEKWIDPKGPMAWVK